MATKLGSNNPFPSILLSESTATPTTPSTGYQRTFIRSSDHHFCRVTSSAGVEDLETITEAKLSLSDVTTFDTSTGRHGFAPKLVGDATKYLSSTGGWTVPSSTGSGTPGGSSFYTQYNDAGAFGGIAPSSSGYVLTSNGSTSAPSFQAPVSSGSLVLLEQHTASSSASLDFTTFISGTYDEYQIECVNVLAATNGANLVIRMGTGAGPSWDSSGVYQWSLAQWSQTGSGGSAGGNADTSIRIGNSLSNTATSTWNGSYKFLNPASTASHKFVTGHYVNVDSSPNFNAGVGGGKYGSTTAVTGVQFLMSSGNIASGTIRVYGLAK